MFGNMFSTDIGMDLGTCNTLVYIKGKGLVINEPSVVAIEKNTKRVISVGKEAKNMLLRTPTDIVAIRPLRDGVIADIETTGKMIRHFIAMGLPRRWLVKPRMVIGIPSCITEVERRAECSRLRPRACHQLNVAIKFLLREKRGGDGKCKCHLSVSIFDKSPFIVIPPSATRIAPLR